MDSKDERRTPAAFSEEETEAIREQVRKGSHDLTCPRCGGEIKQTTAAGGGSIATVWEMGCRECNRTAIMRDIF